MRLICTIIFATLSIACLSQQKLPTIHVGGVLHSYTGDMGNYDNTGAGFQAGIQLNKKKRFNGAFNIGLGQISDDYEVSPMQQQGVSAPNTFFKTNFFFGNYDLHYNFLKKEKITAYISQGIGFLFFNPKNEQDQNLSELPETRQEGEDYRNSTLILPTSVGIIYQLAEHVGVGFQSSIMNTSTDYLDNISEFGDSNNDNILSFRFSMYVSLASKE